MADLKRCGRCRQRLPTTSFGVRRASSDGLQNYCRDCVAEWSRQHRPRKLRDAPEVGPGEKWCRRCEQTKEVDAFARNKSAPDGLQGQCRDCAAASYRARREGQGKLVRPADVPDGHKFCRSCRTIKPHAAWSKQTKSSDGLQSSCKECTSLAGRRSHFARSYGLTVADLERMLGEQDGVCAICRTAEAVHVDHDHATGQVRGMLCFRCNAALGHFDDQPAVLRRAADYLETTGSLPAIDDGAGTLRARLSRSGGRSLIDLAWRARLADADHGTAS